MAQKSISEELSEIISKLSVDQRRYVVARMDYPTLRETAIAIGLKPNTVYKWPPDVNRAVELLSQDIVSGTKAIRLQALAKAMLVKTKGLDSDDERIRQGVATELIEWELGKAQSKTDVTTHEISYAVFNVDELTRIQAGENEMVVYADALKRITAG